MLKTTVEIIGRYLALECKNMKSVEDVERESALGFCCSRWKEAKSKKLYVICRASRSVVTSTEPNIDSVDTRKIDNDEVVLNRTRAWTRQAAVSELDH
jgi:hypothetical protein